MKKSKKERKQIEILQDVLTSIGGLEKGKGKTMNEIAKETGHHKDTIELNLNIIEICQDHPVKIDIIETKSQKIVKEREEPDHSKFDYPKFLKLLEKNLRGKK